MALMSKMSVILLFTAVQIMKLV